MTIEPTDKSCTTIRVYDSTGNAKVTVKAYRGDVIDYKRNGFAGSFRCIVSNIRPDRVQLVPESGGRAFSVPTSSRQFQYLFRGEQRITA